MQTETLRTLVSEKEKQIVRLAVQGLPSSEIGERLSLSESEVEEDLKELYQRLGVADRFALIIYSLTYGLPS